ncbi:MAG: oligosaccharide flippase family protein [Armatimonadetes bacterium]|nr:oligosaccharide flippase family protein [Akkermansiaceae bacterium]
MTTGKHDQADTAGYRTIFKSSSLLGGSQGVCYVFGLARTKALAYLLGPAGVGLVGLYASISGTLGTFAGMGLGESSIREVATAHGSGSPVQFGRAVKIIRRACFMSGIVGVVLSIIFANYLSVQSFGNGDHTKAIMILGLTLLGGAFTAGEMAILQGTGRYMEMAKMNIVSSVVGILPVVLIYVWWQERGIIPAFLMGSLLSALTTRWFSRTVTVPGCCITWKETLAGIKPLFSLGAAFMLTGLLWAGKDMVIRSSITRTYGLDSAGIYQSAWAVSGLFVNFVLRAMGMDFYPRLTAMIGDHGAMVRAVNQQIEIGVLLALPGVIATITCAPMVILILYSSKFHAASGLLAVMSCGVFFKVVSYPLNTIQLAKGDARGFAAFGIGLGLFEAVITVLMLWKFGLMGSAVAFPIACLVHVFAMGIVGRRTISYQIERECRTLLFAALGLISISLVVAFFLQGYNALGVGVILSAISSIYSMRGLARRLGSDHRIVKMLARVPGGKFVIP